MLVEIFDISENGEGIGKIDGKVVFVKNALPGDSFEIEITKDKGSYYQGRIVGDKTAVCGGAPLLRFPYEKQLLWKEKRVRDCLERLAKLESPKINHIVGMENPYNYRNKGEFKVNEELPFCNVNCKDCPIQSKKALEVLGHFRENSVKNSEELIIRTSKNGDVLSYTIQKSGYPLLFEGQNLINDYIGNLKLEVDAASFYQVNTSQCEKLYSIVKSYVDEGSFMLDLYCGAGTIGLFCSDKCSKVIGVESVKEAIIQANRNAVINGNVNTSFILGKAEEVVETKLQGVKADIVVLDPPRAGCKESLLKTVASIGPKKLVYVSCNPSTLARDIKILEENGFKFIEATPVDMFPHTAHVETVAFLSKLQVGQFITVDISTSRLTLTAAESKSTYSEIKAYVLEKTGLKVSSLNIAQIKEKCGIKERESYNKPKSDNTKQPNCPKDKEEAILDALRHFKMIQ